MTERTQPYKIAFVFITYDGTLHDAWRRVFAQADPSVYHLYIRAKRPPEQPSWTDPYVIRDPSLDEEAIPTAWASYGLGHLMVRLLGHAIRADDRTMSVVLLSGSCFPLRDFSAVHEELAGRLAGKTVWFEIHRTRDTDRVACISRLVRGLGSGEPMDFAVKTPMQGVVARRHAALLVDRYESAPAGSYDLEAQGVFADECLIPNLLYYLDIDGFKGLFDRRVIRHKCLFDGRQIDVGIRSPNPYVVSNFHYSIWEDRYLHTRIDVSRYRSGTRVPYVFTRVDAALVEALRDIGVFIFRKVSLDAEIDASLAGGSTSAG
jgi:hypothetical protein